LLIENNEKKEYLIQRKNNFLSQQFILEALGEFGVMLELL